MEDKDMDKIKNKGTQKVEKQVRKVKNHIRKSIDESIKIGGVYASIRDKKVNTFKLFSDATALVSEELEKYKALRVEAEMVGMELDTIPVMMYDIISEYLHKPYAYLYIKVTSAKGGKLTTDWYISTDEEKLYKTLRKLQANADGQAKIETSFGDAKYDPYVK